jgi:hypothetical protein
VTVAAAGEELAGVEFPGQMTVVWVMISVVTFPTRAGQSVTVAAQEVTV